MNDWTTLFGTLRESSSKPLEPRPQQAVFGQHVIDAFATKTALVAECPTGTGKSVGYLVPLIDAIKSRRETSPTRGIVSTETIALQDQLVKKDLPMLQKVYGGFSFRVLKGRSNYVCLDQASYSARGNSRIVSYYTRLSDAGAGKLGDGERADAERVLGVELDDYTWSFLSGSSTFCAENRCTDPTRCFSTRARALAAQADIVVINHALLHVNLEMDDGFLGDFDYLVVDEAHTLEQVLVDGWSESISEWELQEMHGTISKALSKSQRIMSVTPDFIYKTEQVLEGLEDSLDWLKRFYSLVHPQQEWSRLSEALCEKTIYGTPSSELRHAMEEHEVQTPKRLAAAIEQLDKVKSHLQRAISELLDSGIPGVRDIGKGVTAARKLKDFCELVSKSMATRDGLVLDYGVPTGVIVDGYDKRDGSKGMRVRTVPIDISSKAEDLWKNVTPVLVSATLTDLTDGSFKYLTDSIGFPEYTPLKTDSPFDYVEQQLTYITRATHPVVDVPNARYSFDELIELIEASHGRALVLFTARGELEHAAMLMNDLKFAGHFPHSIYVQDKDTSKQKLVDAFMHDTSSVLLATKSFFTGVDFPGDTCSLVAICKFPLPRYDVTCRQQIAWWRGRGYPRWYEREALTVFQQAAGRLIRTGSDRGVVAVLDQRVVNASERVYQTARIGVDALKSPVTREVEDVRAFLS